VENFKEFKRRAGEGGTKVLSFNKINNIEIGAEKNIKI